MAFGGSGPIHAAGLARELSVARVIVPPLPGLFSALGLLFSGIEHHEVRSCLLSGAALRAEALQAVRAVMEEGMLAQFAGEGYAAGQVELSCSFDVRFKGQTSEIRVPLEGRRIDPGTVGALCGSFEAEHEQLYGHRSDADNPIEVVAVRLVGRAGARGQDQLIRPALRPGRMEPGRQACFDGDRRDTPVLERSALARPLEGPVLIDEYDSTIVVPPGVRASLDEQGNIVMDLKDV